ncbi:GNAT family N-acetyltransferase [Halorarum salinum]|uniref:GNAT family N-acetyltransferase n=1 Tax=Halorarum salinum TaxID=2743089 RepID=A0A7D5LEM2_9EURY|nr:GNAT family N-acetyltransferase [Halobaculum salinum]QLG64209.1 GNAT family N-acetyltransferase [Halobaculum salinum]
MEFVPFEVDRDGAEVANVVSRSMQASYALSPEQIEAAVREEFSEDALARKADEEDVVLLVAREEWEAGGRGHGEADETGDGTEIVEEGEASAVQGVAEGTVDEDGAEIRWLQVDPETRGKGIGTGLFERLADAFEERGADEIRSNVLSEDMEGGTFCERFGFVRVDGVEVEFGDETFVAEVYASPNAVDPESAEQFDPLGEDEEPPERAEAPDGTEAFLDPDDPLSGTIGPFFEAYATPDFEDRYGYFCGACRTVTTEVDGQDRIVCPECGNRHRPADWDGSYL